MILMVFFSKEINRFKHLLLRKTDVFKSCWKIKFLGKKTCRNVLVLKRKKVEGIFGETFILALFSSAVFRRQNRVSDFFNLFCSGDKRLLSEFLKGRIYCEIFLSEHFMKYSFRGIS